LIVYEESGIPSKKTKLGVFFRTQSRRLNKLAETNGVSQLSTIKTIHDRIQICARYALS